MKKIYKKIIILLSLLTLIFSNVSCATIKNEVGSYEKGKIDIIDWHEYDEMIKKARMLNASKERDLLLHKIEEKLMQQYCVIPASNIVKKTLNKKYLHGIYVDSGSVPHLENIYYDDGRKVANVQVGGEPETLDPSLSSDSGSHTYILNQYGALTKYDEEGRLVNDLLDSYNISEDGLTYTLTIKNNARWSDGKQLTSNDFIYAMKRSIKPETGSRLSFIYGCIEGYPHKPNIEYVDDFTFKVKLNTVTPYFLSLFTAACAMPLREDIVENDKDWFLKTPAITCGPYFLSEWKHKESMVFEKNPYYYNADKVKVDRINFMLNGNATSIYNAYTSSDIDFTMAVLPDLVSDEVKIYKTFGVNYFVFNTKSKLFESMTCEEARKFRKAISYCIDRKFMEGISNNNFPPANVFVNDCFYDSTNEKFYRDSDIYTYPNDMKYVEDIDLDKARELLKEIGYHFDKNGKVIENIAFELMATTNDTIAVFQNDLSKIGIKINIKKLDFAYIRKGDYTLAYSGWFADYFDPLANLELYESTNGNNYPLLGRDMID